MANNISDVGVNIAEKSAMIWSIADTLTGPFKHAEFGLVMLPMTVVKRFHDCLLPTHDEVLKVYEDVKNFDVIDGFLMDASGYQFYNISKFTFETLLADPENIEANFKDYLAGFSANVQEILTKFEFDDVIRRMVESNTLYLVLQAFNGPKGYLGPDKVSTVDCGYIFEDLVRRFNEDAAADAGEYFTSRDIIYLMTDLMLCGEDMTGVDNITVYDMAMGTSQMLTCMEERVHQMNPETEVSSFGQEINPHTFAIAKADMLIRGGNPDNMRFGDTLSDDRFKGYQFRYIISNPPFGREWKREQKAVEEEAKLGTVGRFAPGLPKISDGQQLFVLNGLHKLAPGGKMAIIQNGSPLFTGDAESGPDKIRGYMLGEHDWLEAIVQLPGKSFMNTPIDTYIWILTKDKHENRRDKVLLINAAHCSVPRRKSIGSKQVDITDECCDLVAKAYSDFTGGFYGDKDGAWCEAKLFDRKEFAYSKITVERPQRDENGKTILKKGKPVADSALRDSEMVPMTESIDEYFTREVLPYAPDAWIDTKKTKIGYEIPMTRYFYEYQPPEDTATIATRLHDLEIDISSNLSAMFEGE